MGNRGLIWKNSNFQKTRWRTNVDCHLENRYIAILQ